MVKKLIDEVCNEFNITQEKLLEKKHKGENKTIYTGKHTDKRPNYNALYRQIVCWLYSCHCEYSHGKIKTLKPLKESLDMNSSEISYAIHHVDELCSIDKTLRLRLKKLLNNI
jgi:hypothetical protein